MYYRVDGVVEKVMPANGKSFTYKELQEFVESGGCKTIEIVPLPSGNSIVVNEEGKLIGLDFNANATEVWRKEYPIADYPHNNDELIVGDALVCSEAELAE